jgi:cysteine desulfurase / selenocysteine lyase
MTTNMSNSNHFNGNNGHQAVVEPSVIQAMANQFYTALPTDRVVPAAEGVGTVPQPSSQIPTNNGFATVPQPSSQIPTHNGVALLGNAPTPTSASIPSLSNDPLTAIAQQLYCQMRGSVDPQLQHALAGLTPSLTPPSNLAAPSSGFPTTTTPPSNLATPSSSHAVSIPTGNLPSDRFDIDAISRLARDLSGQIPSISKIPSLVGSIDSPTPPTMPHPQALVTGSEVEVQRGIESVTPASLRSPTGTSFNFNSTGEPFDVHVIRRDFPILHQQVNGRPLIWMDNAATTQKPQSVIDSLSRFYERDNSNIHRAAHTLAARATDAYEGAREKVQRFLGASDASEIVFVRGTTEAINLVANTFGRKYIRAGDEIILSTLEHHANIVPWQMLAQATGAVIKVIPINDRGEINMGEYTRLLNSRTRIVSITQVSNSLGTVVPVAEMTHLAHRHGARVLVDGAQAVSHMPIDVQAIGCDFYVFSGHKLFAPTGIGALYAKQELLEDLPPWQGGGSMIRHVTFEETIYSDPPAKFEAGTPNIADAVGLGTAIDYITRLGMSNIERYEHEITAYATERLARIPGLRPIGTALNKVSVLSFILDDIPTEQVGQMLAQEGIAVRAGHHCAQPSLRHFGLATTVRPSLAFYNTRAEIDRLVEVIKNIRHR